MPLIPINLPPGINKEVPSLTSEPAWRDSDKVRFKAGQPERIGGWTEVNAVNAPFQGIARSIIAWRSNTGLIVSAIGTHKKLYIYIEQYFDITPLRDVTYLTNPFATTISSSTVTVNHTAHGATTGDVVRFQYSNIPELPSGTVDGNHTLTVVDPNSYTISLGESATATNTATGGETSLNYSRADPFDITNLSTTMVVNHTNHGANTGDFVTFHNASDPNFTDLEVNANHEITLIDENSYSVQLTTAATATTNGCGGKVVFEYEVPIGNQHAVPNFGYGAGAYGGGGYGDARVISTETAEMRYWSLDHFGEDLVCCPNSGRIYTWAFDSTVSKRAKLITESPLYNDIVIVTNPDRHLVTLATESIGAGSTGVQDKMLVQWPDQETLTDWIPTAENTAGDQILSGGSRILAVDRSQSATLIWTNGGLYSMEFQGPPFTFGFQELGRNCGAISHECVVSHNSMSFWMSENDFFLYDGTVRTIPCSVHRYVFENINLNQKIKVVAGLIKNYHEVIWLYPTVGKEIDSYVIYNFKDNVWYNGTFNRTIWLDSELHPYPLAADPNGLLYWHEFTDDNDATAVNAYIESAEFDIGEGDKFIFGKKLIPDMVVANGNVQYTLKYRRYPHAGQLSETTQTVTQSTEKLDVRIRGRQIALNISSDAMNDRWQMGISRLDIRPDGKK